MCFFLNLKSPKSDGKENLGYIVPLMSKELYGCLGREVKDQGLSIIY